MKSIELNSDEFSESDLRLDAGFHLSEGVITSKLIKSSQIEMLPLSKITTRIFSGKIFKRTYVRNLESGYRYLTASDMMKSDINSGVFLSRKYTVHKDELKLAKNWILLSCSGTLGNTVLTNGDYEDVVGTHDLIRIIPDPEKIEPGYLFAFLTSRYGYSLLVQPSYGGVIKHIEPHHIMSLPVPLMEKNLRIRVNNNMLKAGDLREKANELLKAAELKLISSLQLDPADLNILTAPYERETALHYEVDFNDLNQKTFRARNYSKRKRNIIDVLKSKPYDKLSDVLKELPSYGGRYKRITVKKEFGVELLSQGDIFSAKPKGRIISTRAIKNISEEYVKRGTTLIPAQGTLGENEIFGRAKFVWGYLDDKLIAGHAMRFSPDEEKIPAGYLHAVLSSSLWFRIFRSTVYGTNLLGFIIDLIVDYPIPRLEKNEENDIDKMVKQAYDYFTEANYLEDWAVDKIENEIESWQK